MLKSDSNLWSDIKDIWLYRAVDLGHIKEVFGIKYRIKTIIIRLSVRLRMKIMEKLEEI